MAFRSFTTIPSRVGLFSEVLTGGQFHSLRQFRNSSATALPPSRKPRVVVAVGGNALCRRGDALTIENQNKAARAAAPMIKALMQEHEVVFTHGNGPQVGVLAMERSGAPFDVLGAESHGQIGYAFARALASVGVTAVPIITQVEVDPQDPAFLSPTKFVGPIYDEAQAKEMAARNGWEMKQDGSHYRRVVASPPALGILQASAVAPLLAMQSSVGPLPIVCGGGGVPVAKDQQGEYHGIEAVVDKDRCGALLALEIEADGFVILTDGGGIFKNFGKPDQREMRLASPEYLRETKAGKRFPGSMAPKVEAALDFVERSPKAGAWAAIGDLNDAQEVFTHAAGTLIQRNVPDGVLWWDQAPKEQYFHFNSAFIGSSQGQALSR